MNKAYSQKNNKEITKMKKKLKKGFTLVELVIVIAVIAILSAVLIPTFGNVIQNANDSAAFSTASNALTKYTTSMAEAQQSTSLPDGYVVVLKKNAEFKSSDATLTALDPDNVQYVFRFENNSLKQYKDDSSTTKIEYTTELSGKIVSLGDTYKSKLNDAGQFVKSANDDQTADKVAPITFDTTNKTVKYWGAYILDGNVKFDGANGTVSGKVILLGNVKTA